MFIFLEELIIEGFDFNNVIKCSHAHDYEKLNKSSMNSIEMNFYKDVYDDWKNRLFPFEFSEDNSNIVLD